ncbi:MAG TPA: peptide ABC transporter substrate-binding protein [Candidatus Dormibacteraeota bacterium]
MAKLKSAGAFLAGISLLLGGACGNPQGGGPSQSVTKGGTLTLAIWQEPSSLLYPFYSNQTVANLTSELAIEGLVRIAPDGSYQPVLIKDNPTQQNGDVKISSDGSKMDVTYHLIPNLKWADGAPFTSADVQFTWKVFVTDPKIVSRAGYDSISSVDTPDDLTAVVHYKEIFSPYLGRFLQVLPKHALASISDISKSDFARMPFGTGPFKFTENQSGDHITAVKNPNYRVPGKPNLDRIIFRVVPSREAAIAQLEAHEVDAMWNLLESQQPTIKKHTDLTLSRVAGPSVERLEFNLAKPGNPADPSVPHPVLGDPAVREALLLATPKQRIIDKLLNGLATPGNSPLSIGVFAPKDLKQASYDPARAKQLLDQAGWVPGADGIRSKGGVRAHLSISTTTGDKIREEVEVVLVDEFKGIGIELEVKNYPSSVLLGSWSGGSPRNRGNYDITMYASSPDPDPHTTLVSRYTTSGIPTTANNGVGFNYSRFSSSQVDQDLADAGHTLDVPRRQKDYADALKVLNDSYIAVWIYNRSALDAFSAKVGGWKPNGWDNLTWDTQDWFLSKS